MNSYTGIEPSIIGRTQGAYIDIQAPRRSFAGQEALMRGAGNLMKGADAAVGFALHKTDQENEAALATALSKFNGDFETRLQNNVYTLQGENAEGAQEQARNDFEAARDNASKDLNPWVRKRFDENAGTVWNATVPRIARFRNGQVNDAIIKAGDEIYGQTLKNYAATGDIGVLKSLDERIMPDYIAKFGNPVTDEALEKSRSDILNGYYEGRDGKRTEVPEKDRARMIEVLENRNKEFRKFRQDRYDGVLLARSNSLLDIGDIRGAKILRDDIRNSPEEFPASLQAMETMDLNIDKADMKEATGIYARGLYKEAVAAASANSPKYNSLLAGARVKAEDYRMKLREQMKNGNIYAAMKLETAEKNFRYMEDLIKARSSYEIAKMTESTNTDVASALAGVTKGKTILDDTQIEALLDLRRQSGKEVIDSDFSPASVIRYGLMDRGVDNLIRNSRSFLKKSASSGGAAAPKEMSITEQAGVIAANAMKDISSMDKKYITGMMESAKSVFVENLSSGKSGLAPDLERAVMSQFKTKWDAFEAERSKALTNDMEPYLRNFKNNNLYSEKGLVKIKETISGVKNQTLRMALGKAVGIRRADAFAREKGKEEARNSYYSQITGVTRDLQFGGKKKMAGIDGVEREYDLDTEEGKNEYLLNFDTDIQSEVQYLRENGRIPMSRVGEVMAPVANEVLDLTGKDALSPAAALAAFPREAKMLYDFAMIADRSVNFNTEAGEKWLSAKLKKIMESSVKSRGLIWDGNMKLAQIVNKMEKDASGYPVSPLGPRIYRDVYWDTEDVINFGRTMAEIRDSITGSPDTKRTPEDIEALGIKGLDVVRDEDGNYITVETAEYLDELKAKKGQDEKDRAKTRADKITRYRNDHPEKDFDDRPIFFGTPVPEELRSSGMYWLR